MRNRYCVPRFHDLIDPRRSNHPVSWGQTFILRVSRCRLSGDGGHTAKQKPLRRGASSGSPGRTRTSNHSFNIRALCQLSYRGIYVHSIDRCLYRQLLRRGVKELPTDENNISRLTSKGPLSILTVNPMKIWWWAGLVLAVAGVVIVGWHILDHNRPPVELSESEQRFLLQLARRELEAVLAGEPGVSVDPNELSAMLKRKAACFVTLTKNGVQRGCMIDSLYPHESIYQNILRNVVLAATGDERYPPMTLDELDAVRIEINILNLPKRLHFRDPEELLGKLHPGTDGVILRAPLNFATYLPQVWRLYPEPDQFLSHLCEKADARPDCWRERPLPEVEIYQTFHFSEDESPR
jgi:AmmeMemoRadiSam system protein A